MKTITEITLYDLMAEDLDITVTKDKRFGFVIQLENDYGKNVVEELGIHPFAADSFASFCRQYLASYERATKESER